MDGGCSLSFDPGYAVQGKTRTDQQWISATQESFIRVCHFTRPQPHKATLLHRKPTPKPVGHIVPSTPPATITAPVTDQEPAVQVPAPPVKQDSKTKKEIKKMQEQLRSLELKLHRT